MNPFLSWVLMLRKQGLSSTKYEFTIANLNNATEKKKQKLVVMSRTLGNYWDLRIPRGVFVIAEKWFVQFTEWMMLVAKMSQIKTITMWCKEKHNWLFFLFYFVFPIEKSSTSFYDLVLLDVCALSSSTHLSVKSLIFFCIRILVLTSWIPASENLDICFDIKNLLILLSLFPIYLFWKIAALNFAKK